MTTIKTILSILSFSIILSCIGQEKESHKQNKITEAFKSIDQISFSLNTNNPEEPENLNWTRLIKVYVENENMVLEYYSDKQQDKIVYCFVPLKKINSNKLIRFESSGIPCLKLNFLDEDAILKDENKSITGQTKTIYLRPCYFDHVYDEIKSALIEISKNPK